MKVQDRSTTRRARRAAVATAFVVVGLTAQLAGASTAEARRSVQTVYLDDGVVCQYIGYPFYWTCYTP